MENNIIRFNTYKLERGGLLYDMYDQFNARVGDQGTPLVMQWLQGLADTEVDLQAQKLHFYATGQVGKYLEKLKDGTGYQMSADASQVEYEDRNAAGTMDHGITKVKLPKQFFPQEGIFYGYFGLKDAQGNTYTSINVWFRVLGGVPIMGAAIPYFSTRFDELMEQCQGRIEDALTQLRQEYQDEVKKNQDLAAETRAALSDLAASVGHIQSLINAGDVVPRTEYQNNKEATDTAVEANTKELQSHDAQLKQLTASPASDGTTEITNARIGTAEQSARTYDTLGEAIRDQAGQITRAVKQSFTTSYIAYPFHKEDDIAYVKDVKSTQYSAGSYYFNITGSALLRIQTTVEPYINYFTFLDANGKVLDYQRSDDKKSTVDFVVSPPSSAATLVLGTEPNSQTAHDSVTVYTNKLEIGKVYQGNISDSSFSLDANMLRASIAIDSDKYENFISVDSAYQVSDDHMDSWDSQVLIPQGSGIKSVLICKADDGAFNATDVYDHLTLMQIPKSELHLKSYRNGLTDISDTFSLNYTNIFQDNKDNHYYYYNKSIPIGTRIASQFVTVSHNVSWLIDLDDKYQVSFITAKPNGQENVAHDFYNNTNVLKTAVNWVGGHVYENLYTQGTYAVVFRKKDDSLININTIWDHVRIYEVDNTVHFPDYYRSHMQDRVDTINSKLTSPSDFGFGFITDVHAEFNTKHFPALIDEVRTKTPVNEFMGGGDWATAWFDSENDADNKPELFHFFEELQQLFKGVPLLKTVGNHEWAYGANNGYNITSQEMYAYYLRDEDKMFNDIQWGSDHTYYYWDDKLNHCRFISLNVMDYQDTIKPTGNADNKEWYFKVGDTQIQWLKDTLNSVPDGYVVAIESHLVPLSADQFASFPAAKIGTTISNGEDLQAIASAYAAKTGDFTSAKGDLLGWFGGHYHADDITVRNGVTYITTIADCMSIWDIKGAPQKTAGTVSEQAFDVATVDRANRKVNLIRIGDGSDRSFTY